jgi:5-methylcytosine-specific restriction endonuclease McrA
MCPAHHYTEAQRLESGIRELQRQLLQVDQSVTDYSRTLVQRQSKRSIATDLLDSLSNTRQRICASHRRTGWDGSFNGGVTPEGQRLLVIAEAIGKSLTSCYALLDTKRRQSQKHLERNQKTKNELENQVSRLTLELPAARERDAVVHTTAEKEVSTEQAIVKAQSVELARIAAPRKRLQALAATTTRQRRELARRVGQQLRAEQSTCPYCGRELDGNAHADHIYPIAKGGLSILANMVLVCADCNAKKSDLTLRVFIQTFGLDRKAVETRLSQLGKDF